MDRNPTTAESPVVLSNPPIRSDAHSGRAQPDGNESPRLDPSRTPKPRPPATPWPELGIGILLSLAAAALLVVLLRNLKAVGDANRFTESLQGGTPSQKRPG
jgi:hypothetical protein